MVRTYGAMHQTVRASARLRAHALGHTHTDGIPHTMGTDEALQYDQIGTHLCPELHPYHKV